MNWVLWTTRATALSTRSWIRRYCARRSTIGTFMRRAVYLSALKAARRYGGCCAASPVPPFRYAGVNPASLRALAFERCAAPPHPRSVAAGFGARWLQREAHDRQRDARVELAAPLVDDQNRRVEP